MRDPDTIAAITELASAERLVLYCGAGTTRDQTGLGWDGMVAAVFEAAKSSRRTDRELNERIRKLLSNPALEPQQKASIVTRYLKPKNRSESQFLSRYLSQVLYEERGWGEGFLLRNIAALAFGMSQIGRRVTLVTTNYDDYLLRRLRKLVEDAGTEGPGLLSYCLGDEDRPLVSIPARGSLPTIELVFVHGFAPPRGSDYASSGEIVFSEQSYQKTQQRTSDYLRSLMDGSATFLTIGASIADPPLINAIVRGSAEGARVYSLIDLPWALNEDLNDDIVASQTQSLLAARASHLGIRRALSPANFSQVAQFVEEIRVSAYLTAASQPEHELYRTSGNYASRLNSWWQNWSISAQASAHEDHYLLLATGLDILRDKLESFGCRRSDEELLRLEMWVRLDPSISRAHRHLTLFANSSGHVLDIRSRREEVIRRASPISSVKSFVSGKPTLSPLTALGFSDSASRWKTFLSVPVFHEVSIESPDLVVPVTGSVPLGVVTLSSSLPMEQQAADRACFVDTKLGNSEYKEILSVMIEVGREVVTGF